MTFQVLWDFVPPSPSPHDSPTFVSTGAGVRLDTRRSYRRGLFRVSHSMVLRPTAVTPSEVADVVTSKVLTLRAMDAISVGSLQRWLRKQYEAHPVPAHDLEAVLCAFEVPLSKGDTVLIGYEPTADATVFAGPRSSFTSVDGVEVMRATWRSWFLAKDQPDLGQRLVSRLRPDVLMRA